MVPAGKLEPDQILYTPELLSLPDESRMDHSGSRLFAKQAGTHQIYRRDHFETIFATADDPWKYTSDYERVKYEQTLGLLPDLTYAIALEIGCAQGHFTEMLAPRVNDLVAADISQIALDRATARCANLKNIHFVQLDITKDLLPGAFDLIVCSEILYYVGDRQALKAIVQKIAKALKPGGYLLTSHAHLVVDEPDRAGFDWGMPFGAKGISDVMVKDRLLVLCKEVRVPLYRIQLFQRKPHLVVPKFLKHAQVIRLEEQPAPLHPEIASHVLWNGAELPMAAQDQLMTTRQLPILMYHRVAPEGSVRLADYRVTPAAFEDQLRYLGDAGYYSISLDEWRVAMELRRPLPGKPVLITFDDGYRDFQDFAWPILKQFGFSCIVFLVSGEIGKTNNWDRYYGEEIPLMDWSDILQLKEEGVAFGSHTASHPHLTGISLGEVVQEASISRKLLMEQLSQPIHAFAYPYGSFDRVVQHLVGACGYVYGLTTETRMCQFNDPLLALPRVEISGADNLQTFIQKLQP